MKKLLFLLLALFILSACGGREDEPTPEPIYTLTLTGNWKVKKIQNGTTITPNADASLFVNVTNGNIKYKLPSGATYDGWGKVSQPSNAESINLDNGTKLTMFKTANNDGDINFNFIHSNGTKDDVWVRLY